MIIFEEFYTDSRGRLCRANVGSRAAIHISFFWAWIATKGICSVILIDDELTISWNDGYSLLYCLGDKEILEQAYEQLYSMDYPCWRRR